MVLFFDERYKNQAHKRPLTCSVVSKSSGVASYRDNVISPYLLYRTVERIIGMPSYLFFYIDHMFKYRSYVF